MRERLAQKRLMSGTLSKARGVRSLREVTERRRRTPREPERSEGTSLAVESLWTSSKALA